MTQFQISQAVHIDYTNWRGERKWYKVIPTGKMWFGVTPYHKTPQWLIDLVVLDKEHVRTFAMADIHEWGPTAP